MNPSETIIDLSAIVSPISSTSPTGKDLRQDKSSNSLYYHIKDARNAARAIERQKMQDGQIDSLPLAQWSEVQQLATEILISQSKDLEICVWLIEALLRKYGFAGLRDGFCCARTLCQQFWSDFYPQLEDNDVAARLSPLAGLNGGDVEGTLIFPINNVLVIQGQNNGSFTFWQYQQAVEISQIKDPKIQANRLTAGVASLKEIEAAAAETSSEFFRNLQDELQSCISEFNQLTQYLDEKCGADSPPSSRILHTLTHCSEILKSVGKAAFIEVAQPSIDTKLLIGGKMPDTKNASLPISNLNMASINREQAFYMMGQLLDYFRQTEPHSPVSYLIQKAIHWGKLPLPQLFAEVISDSKTLSQLYTLMGIEQPS